MIRLHVSSPLGLIAEANGAQAWYLMVIRILPKVGEFVLVEGPTGFSCTATEKCVTYKPTRKKESLDVTIEAYSK
jgi:hypothetical protein